MFDGNHRSSRREVNLSGKRKNATKQTLLEQSRVRREERRIANQRASAATRVQCRHRGNIDRRRLLEAWSHQVRQGFTSSRSGSSNPSTSAADSVTRVLEALFRLASVAPAWQGTVTQLLPDYAEYLTTTRNNAFLSSGSDPPHALHMVLATLRLAKAGHSLCFEDIRVILTYLLKVNSVDSDDDKGSTRMGVRVFQPMIELLCESESSNHDQYHHQYQSPLRTFLRQCIAKSLPAGTQKDAVTLVLGLAFRDVSSSRLPQHLETLRWILADHVQLSNKYPLLLTILASRHSVKILVEAANLFLQHPTLVSGSCWLWLFQFSQREMSTGFNPIDQSLVLWAMNRLARGDSLQMIVDTDTTMKNQKEFDDFDSDYYDDDDGNDGLVTKISLQRDVASSSLLTSPRRADRQELSTIAKLDRHFLSLTRKADEWYAGHSSGLQPGVENLANPQLWHQLGIFILSQGSEKEKSNYIILLFIILQSLSSAAINRSSLSSQLLNKLSFSLEFIERLWAFLETKMKSRSDPHTWSSDFISALAIFATTFSHYLVALRDEQFLARHTNLVHTPLSATEKRSVPVRCVIDIYKEILGHLYLEAPVCQSDFQILFAKHDVIVSGLSTRSTSGNDTELAAMRAQLILTGTKLFQSLHNRWTRLVVTAPFCDENVWWIDAVVKTGILNNDANDMVVDDKQNDLADSFRDPKVARLLSAIPMVLPFNQRVELFQSLLKHEKTESQNSMEEAARAIEAMIRGEEPRRSAQIEIHRDKLFDDSMEQLNALGKRMKQKIQVSFVNRHGAAEAGIDGGGVFREFIDDLIHEAFLEEGSDHRPKLFTVTPNQTLMINTDVAVNEHNLVRFEFLGRVLGKALYESILVEPQFCLPFLNQLLGKSNSLDDLKNLDAEYYNNLIKLLTMSIDDLEGLGLCFEASVGNISSRSVELVPNGRNIPVNKQNVISYVHLVANMKLNAEPSRQTKAFLRGFQDLISSTWVRLFSAHELQKLISGDDSLRGFDVEALKRSMHYAAGYHPDQQIIQWFWEVLEEFSTEQKHLFLKFMTSCSRQPLLGFGSLEPAPCVQQIRLPDSLFQEGNLERLAKESPLPTSSTCMNLLKLPNYRSKELLKHKLLAAIESGSGFELT